MSIYLIITSNSVKNKKLTDSEKLLDYLKKQQISKIHHSHLLLEKQLD